MGVVTYYDGFRERLLEDYRIQNKRVVAALDFAEESLGDAESVLDVGCGIGWSSDYLRERGYEVTGLDLSPVLIQTARETFGGAFVCADFPTWEPQPYDAVLMIDVYEHFPRNERDRVHSRLRETGASRIVLTVPTVANFEFARANGIPLQPIDEDVTDDDLARLAEDVGGRVTVNRLVSIWREGDYRHVLVTR